MFVANAFGKLAGSPHINELGERVADALIDYMLTLPGNEDVSPINPVVGEIKRVISSFIRRFERSAREAFSARRRPLDPFALGVLRFLSS